MAHTLDSHAGMTAAPRSVDFSDLAIRKPKPLRTTTSDRLEQEAESLSTSASDGKVGAHITAASGSSGQALPAPVQDVVARSGQPLGRSDRAYFEQRFGRDLSHVRVHSDRQAAKSVRLVQAHAYTVGASIAFGSGQYQPATSSGRHLLGHELVHVLQQTANGPPAPAPLLQRFDSFEHVELG